MTPVTDAAARLRNTSTNSQHVPATVYVSFRTTTSLQENQQ